MSYTLDLAGKGATGCGPSTILKTIEWGPVNGTNNLFGNWKVEYSEPQTYLPQIYLPPAKSADEEDAGQATVASDAVLLEAEIAALIREAEGSLRRPDAGYWDMAGAFHQPAAGPNNTEPRGEQSKKIESKVNEPRPERRAWDADIKIDDPERAANAASSSGAQTTYAALAALAGACAMGWIIWAPPSLIDGRRSIPVERNVDSSAQVPASKKQTAFAGPATGRETTPNASNTGKIAVPASSVHDHRPGYTKSGSQQPGAIRTSNVLQQSTRPSEPAASDFGHRPKTLPSPSPMPFPETRPETIEGWTVRDVSGATAVLEGPDGVWRAMRGDTVPRVGRVESIVRWGSRWIVVTSSGLISTP
jgi:hypothetical protein